jgi:hypothetical protein
MSYVADLIFDGLISKKLRTVSQSLETDKSLSHTFLLQAWVIISQTKLTWYCFIVYIINKNAAKYLFDPIFGMFNGSTVQLHYFRVLNLTCEQLWAGWPRQVMEGNQLLSYNLDVGMLSWHRSCWKDRAGRSFMSNISRHWIWKKSEVDSGIR